MAAIASNIPEMFEVHFRMPMIGAVLNAINTRLDDGHVEAKVLMVDPKFAGVAKRAVEMSHRKELLVVDMEDPEHGPAEKIGVLSYKGRGYVAQIG